MGDLSPSKVLHQLMRGHFNGSEAAGRMGFVWLWTQTAAAVLRGRPSSLVPQICRERLGSLHTGALLGGGARGLAETWSVLSKPQAIQADTLRLLDIRSEPINGSRTQDLRTVHTANLHSSRLRLRSEFLFALLCDSRAGLGKLFTLKKSDGKYFGLCRPRCLGRSCSPLRLEHESCRRQMGVATF